MAALEAGGITQSIDAFTSMRQRGAHVMDAAILAVNAGDGVKPQAKESMGIIRFDKLLFIGMLNKCDRPKAQLGLRGDEVKLLKMAAKTGAGVLMLLEDLHATMRARPSR